MSRGRVVGGFETVAEQPPQPPVGSVVEEGALAPVSKPPARRPAGDTVEGPAVIEEYGSTVPLHPGFVATLDDVGNLWVRRTEAAR